MKLSWNFRKEFKIVLALVGLSFLIAFSERKQGGALCKDIVVDIENINDNHFLDEADILHLVEASGQSIKGTSIARINLKAIEKKNKARQAY
ncbi:MAG: hypothetical protein WDN75_20555 [Bacteroidota bacterium]